MTDNNRRDFLKKVGLTTAAISATASLNLSAAQAASKNSVFGLVAPKMDKVRVGFIGVGQRGSGHVERMALIDGTQIKAICDIRAEDAEKSANWLTENGYPAATTYVGGDDEYKKMLDRDDIDIVIISTPWRFHTPMCVDTMNAGKHAFVEVPAAVTIEECWQLVNTAEKTQKNCMMMENVNYGREELMVLNMVRQGVFGELLHGEAAYIHPLRFQMMEIEKSTGSWRTGWHTKHVGNLYPTHGLGPVAQYMNINRGDRFDYLTSMSSPAMGRELYAQRKFPADHQRNQLNYIHGDMSTSLIKTVKGRSIMVQHDTTTPRPYSRHNLIQGTKGVFAGFPNRIALDGDNEEFHNWDENMDPYFEKYDHPLYKRVGEEAVNAGGHGGMDFIMFWRMIYCLRNAEPLDQDVYDAAAWSSIFDLSEKSLSNRSATVDIPDFTRGDWKTNPELGIVS